MNRMLVVGRRAVGVCLTLSAGGCILIAAGAGAGGGVYFTSRGVESVVDAPVEDAFSATERAFEHFAIERTALKVEGEGERRELKGRSEAEDVEVTVTLERESSGKTRMEVTARKSAVTWDKDFARQLLDRIVELAG